MDIERGTDVSTVTVTTHAAQESEYPMSVKVTTEHGNGYRGSSVTTIDIVPNGFFEAEVTINKFGDVGNIRLSMTGEIEHRELTRVLTWLANHLATNPNENAR